MNTIMGTAESHPHCAKRTAWIRGFVNDRIVTRRSFSKYLANPNGISPDDPIILQKIQVSFIQRNNDGICQLHHPFSMLFRAGVKRSSKSEVIT